MIREADLLPRGNPQLVKLTQGPMRFKRVIPSPDGKRLFVLGLQPRSQLVRYDANSGRLDPILPETSILWPNFSRDGQWICYVQEKALWRSRVNGSERRQLTFPPMSTYLPQWSPDGKHIVFEGAELGKPYKIYVVSVEEGKIEQVTTGPLWDADPHWSPDGNSLIFGRFGSRQDPQDRQAVIINRIDLRTKQISAVPGSEGLRSPSWSPSGRYISASTDDMSTLKLFDTTTQKWRPLATVTASFPHWSKDEKYIYVSSGEADKHPAISRVRIADGRLEWIRSLEDIRSPLGFPWAGLAPDGSPVTVRDLGTQDIYSLELHKR